MRQQKNRGLNLIGTIPKVNMPKVPINLKRFRIYAFKTDISSKLQGL